MKKAFILFLMALALVGCQSEKDIYVGDNPHIALIIANRGDMAFNDAAIIGVDNAKRNHNVNYSIIEHGNNKDNLVPRLIEAAENNNKLIVTDGIMTPVIEEYADTYKDISFILFDDELDWSKGDYDNVMCIVYKSNEASYLAGYAAAAASKTGRIGFLGGIDRSINNNFLIGYIQGALKFNPDIKVDIEYTGTYDDPTIGRAITDKMIEAGADVIFGAAGMSNNGMFESVNNHDVYAIGVDTDQALLYQGHNKSDIADNIITSVMKDLSNSIYDNIGKFADHKFESTTVYMDLANQGVGIADNKFYQAILDEPTRNEIENIKQEIIDGKIKVSTTLDKPEEELKELIDSVKP